MKFSNIVVLVILLLPMLGCDEKATGVNSQAGVTSTPEKELSPEESIAKLQREAEAGDADAQLDLGVMYAKGEGVSKDAVKAVEWFQKAEAQGDAMAQYNLGWMYDNGEGVPKDAVKAVEWYQKAAAQGLTDAQNRLGEMYANGKGVPKDAVKAVEWYQKAAAQGDADSQRHLGWMYATGEGVPKDVAKAVEWFQKAEAQGDVRAQYILGVMYAKGEGVPKNAVKAVEWFQKAEAQGDVRAQYNLGWMYAKGEGVPKDAVKAVEWYQKAAAQGYADAQHNLGRMYATGEGVSKDWVRAYAWFNLAAAQGYAGAQSIRDKFEKVLTGTERKEGQKLASNWKKGDALLASNDNSSGTASPKDKPSMPSKQLTGTAFTVSSDGHALTNHHVINGCTEVKVAGREGVAKVITSDSVNDLALLQLPGKSDDIAKLNPDPGKLRQGEDIIVFGYPLNFVLSSGGNLTPGTLSALTGLGNNTNQLQITAPIQPGSSGSPVMDKKGNVVGLVSMKLDDGKMAKATGQVGQNVNFAVNGQTVRAFLDTNNVLYKTGGGLFSTEKSNADIADEARKWTVLVECWK
jgi:TPR repeat protein